MSRRERPSAYRRSYGADKHKSSSISSVSVTPELRKLREKEKEKLKKCNNRLVNYIEKVHDLEEANRILAAENAILRKSGKVQEQDVSELYEDELKRLREKVEDLQVENKKLEIEVDNVHHELEDTEDKLEREKEERKQIEKEVKDLRKDVDDATIERVSLEGKIENLQETLQLERQAHAVELDNLRSQVEPAKASFVENEPSLMPDLNDAISDVRKQYEAFNTKNVEALDAYYKEKIESMGKNMKGSQEENKKLREENAEQRKTIHQLELELEAVRIKTDKLEGQVVELEDLLSKQSCDSQEKIDEINKQLDDAKTDLGQYLRHCQELSNLKLSLEQEIAIYNKLLQGEETRILDVEVADPRSIVRTPDRGRKTSRSRSASKSSSKSGSRSRSRSKSRSRSRSHSSSRDASDVVEEMLENDKEEEKGVISVTWKVKGGTVRPADPFHSDEDAERLRNALKGVGTDEKTIIDILANRTKAQRMAISVAYKLKYEDELLDDLKKDLSGDFRTSVLHLMWRRSVMDANSLRKALKGFGTDEAVLIEILCTQSSREIEDIKYEYTQEFPDRTLEEDIAKETSGAFKDFLLAVLKANRPEDTGTVVANLADADAEALHSMKVKEWSPSNPKFLEIFTKRSFEHLWFLFNQSWPKVSKDDLLETIDSECKGDLKKGLKALIRFSVYIPPVYYATQLHEAMKGFGTEDNQMIYIITARSEIDMVDIKEEFQTKYGVELAKRVKNETKGEYRRMLLALIGEEE